MGLHRFDSWRSNHRVHHHRLSLLREYPNVYLYFISILVNMLIRVFAL